MLKLFAQNRNFRSLLFFSTFGGIGRGMFSIFMMWVVHALYQNPMYTGIAGFMFGAPLVASFIFGPLVDRWNKVRVLRIVELVKLCVVILILVSHIFFYLGPWFIFLAILVFSIASLFGSPAFTAMLPRVVDGEDLVKANVFMNITGIAGGLGLGAGLLILMAGEADFTWVYVINAAVLILSVLFAVFIRSEEPATPTADDSKGAFKTYLSELKTGLTFVKTGVMLPLVVVIVSMSFFADVAYVNFPKFAEVHLGTAFGYVLLSALALTGNLVGSYICRMVDTKFKLGKILVMGFITAGIARIAFVNVIPGNRTGGILIYVLYVGLASAISIFYQVLQQKLPPKNLISRVATTMTSLRAIAAAIGALVGGVLGTLLDVDTVFIIQGASYIAIGVLLSLSVSVRRLPKIGELGDAEESVVSPT